MEDQWLQWVPVFKVQDARKSERFYCEVLGFLKDWEHRFAADFPLYISLSRGAICLHLSEHEGGGTRKGELFIAVKDVDHTYAVLKERGLKVDGPPESHSYGVRDFGFTDPDGHRLVLGTSLDGFGESPGRTFPETD